MKKICLWTANPYSKIENFILTKKLDRIGSLLGGGYGYNIDLFIDWLFICEIV